MSVDHREEPYAEQKCRRTRFTIGRLVARRAPQGNGRRRELDWKSVPCTSCRHHRFAAMKAGARRSLLRRRMSSNSGGQLATQVGREVADRVAAGPRLPPLSSIASGLLMLDDLGHAQGFGNSEAAVLRYDRTGRLAAKTGFPHRLYRLGLHPLATRIHRHVGRLYALRVRRRPATVVAHDARRTPQIQALRRRFAICDEWLKNHIRCVAFARDRSRYLFTAIDAAWCCTCGER